VPLSRADLASLNEEARLINREDTSIVDEWSSEPLSPTLKASSTSSSDKREETERIILNNLTKDQAMMICGPIGEDLWARIGRVEVKGNIAEGNSTMVTYATSLEAFKVLKAHQNEQIEAEREWKERTKRHGNAN